MKHLFSIEKLSEGVFAALSTPGTGSWANAGIIDLGDSTVILDTFATPSAAMELRIAAEQLTGRKATFVINTHHHIDHVHGNQVFSDSAIISTKLTRDQIASRQPRFVETVKRHPEYLDHMRLEIEKETNPLKSAELQNLLGEYSAIDSDIHISTLTLPTVTFDDQILFHGTHRDVELMTYGGGHTVSDSFLYLPEEQILFLADLMHIGHHADFRQGNIDEWINILEKLKKLEIKKIVSGHGGIGAKVDLFIMQEYLINMKKMAHDLSDKAISAENINDVKIPEQYSHYQVPSVFYGTLKFLIESLYN